MIVIKSAAEIEAETIARFQVEMAYETENLILDYSTVLKGVKAVFADGTKGSYFVAKSRDKTVASLLITTEWSDWRNGAILWIQSVYVVPEFRKRGIYSQMYSHIKSVVETDPNLYGIRLYVDKTNQKAINVYNRSGMSNQHYELFEWMK